MAYVPADTAILNQVEARMANITVANGYNNEFKRIVRARMKPFKGHDLPACNIYHGSIGNENTPYGRNRKSQTLIIEVHSKTRDDPFVDIADSLAADVVTGIFRTTIAPAVTDNVSIALGGIVQQLKFLGHDPFIGQGQEPFCGTLVRFEVEYENELGDMEDFT